MTLRYKGGQATFSIAAAKALIEQGDNESLKVLKFGKDESKAYSDGWVLENVLQQQEK